MQCHAFSGRRGVARLVQCALGELGKGGLAGKVITVTVIYRSTELPVELPNWVWQGDSFEGR